MNTATILAIAILFVGFRGVSQVATNDAALSAVATNSADYIFPKVVEALKLNDLVKNKLGFPIQSVTKRDNPQGIDRQPDGYAQGVFICDVVGNKANGTVVAFWHYSPKDGVDVHSVHLLQETDSARGTPPFDNIAFSGASASTTPPAEHFTRTDRNGVEITVNIRKRNAEAIEGVSITIKCIKFMGTPYQIWTNFPAGTNTWIWAPEGTWSENPTNHQVTLVLTNASTRVDNMPPFDSPVVSIPLP